MNIRVFMFIYRLHQKFQSRLDLESEEAISYKKRGVYAILAGFTKAGIYWLS